MIVFAYEAQANTFFIGQVRLLSDYCSIFLKVNNRNKTSSVLIYRHNL